MGQIKKTLGKVPVGRGTYSATETYYKENTVQMYGMSFRALTDMKGVTPASLNSFGKVTLVNTTKWELISGSVDTYNNATDMRNLDGKVVTLENKVDNLKPVQIIGDVTNAADEEDLTVDGQLLKLKDRSNINGMGYVILRQNKTFKEQVTQPNTIYEIRYDFDLREETVEIPSNCVLKFDGGSLTNGAIIFNQTLLEGDYYMYECSCTGTIRNTTIYAEYFSFKKDEEELKFLLSLSDNNKTIIFKKDKTYIIDSRECAQDATKFATISDIRNLTIDFNGCHLYDANLNSYYFTGSSETDQSYFYIITFKNTKNITVKNLFYQNDDENVERADGETSGVGLLTFNNSNNIKCVNIVAKNVSYGIVMNNSYNIDIDAQVDNAGYNLLFNNAKNVNVYLKASIHTHRLIYSGGVQNAKYNIDITNELSITAAGILLQEFWEQQDDGTYHYMQNENIDILVNAYGTISGAPMLTILQYGVNGVHEVVRDKDRGYVIDNLNYTVNFYKKTTSDAFSSSVVYNTQEEADANFPVLVKGKFNINYFSKEQTDVSAIFISCGDKFYNKYTWLLDVNIFAEADFTSTVRATYLREDSIITINSNSNIKGLFGKRYDTDTNGNIIIRCNEVNFPRQILPSIKIERGKFRREIGTSSSLGVFEAKQLYITVDKMDSNESLDNLFSSKDRVYQGNCIEIVNCKTFFLNAINSFFLGNHTVRLKIIGRVGNTYIQNQLDGLNPFGVYEEIIVPENEHAILEIGRKDNVPFLNLTEKTKGCYYPSITTLPNSADIGQSIIYQGKPIWWNGTSWVDANGTQV